MRFHVEFLCCCLVFGACSNAGTPPSSLSSAGKSTGSSMSAAGTAPPAGVGTPAAGTTAPGAAGSAGSGSAVATTGGTSAVVSTAGSGAAGSSVGASAGAGAAAIGGGSESVPSAGTGGDTPAKKQLAVTADFLNQTLSVVDISKFVDGAKREDVLVGTVDLSKYTPGPLAVAVTPDGKTALVSISGGWLTLVASGIPAGNGTLLFVDLESLKVTGELYTQAPARWASRSRRTATARIRGSAE